MYIKVGNSKIKPVKNIPGLKLVLNFLLWTGMGVCRCVDTHTGQKVKISKYFTMYSFVLNIIFEITQYTYSVNVYLCKPNEVTDDTYYTISFACLRTIYVLIAHRMFKPRLIHKFITTIHEIDDAIGPKACEVADKKVRVMMTVLLILMVIKIVSEISLHNLGFLFFTICIRSFQLLVFSAVFVYFIIMITVRVYALKDYVEDKQNLDITILEGISWISDEFIKKEFSFSTRLKQIYERKADMMRIQLVFELQEKISVWAMDFEDNANFVITFQLLHIYINIYFSFLHVFKVFHLTSELGNGIPLQNHIMEILTCILMLVLLAESCQMFLFANERLQQKIVQRRYDSDAFWLPLVVERRYAPKFTASRIATIDRSLIFKFLITVITHGALQAQLQQAQTTGKITLEIN